VFYHLLIILKQYVPSFGGNRHFATMTDETDFETYEKRIHMEHYKPKPGPRMSNLEVAKWRAKMRNQNLI
jgi:hypothetical protein